MTPAKILFSDTIDYYFINHVGLSFEVDGQQVVYHITNNSRNEYGGNIVRQSFAEFLGERTLYQEIPVMVDVPSFLAYVDTHRTYRYNVFTYNCEHFISEALTGIKISPQLRKWLAGSILTGMALYGGYRWWRSTRNQQLQLTKASHRDGFSHFKNLCPMAKKSVKQEFKVRQVLDINSYPKKGVKKTKRYRVSECGLNQVEATNKAKELRGNKRNKDLSIISRAGEGGYCVLKEVAKSTKVTEVKKKTTKSKAKPSSGKGKSDGPGRCTNPKEVIVGSVTLDRIGSSFKTKEQATNNAKFQKENNGIGKTSVRKSKCSDRFLVFGK